MGKQVMMEQVADAFVLHFGRVFGCEIRHVDMEARRSAAMR
jgi:hypothetical protein